ncbi:MAG: hypothetical protein U0871_17680 [Gemmataceae bacterium]
MSITITDPTAVAALATAVDPDEIRGPDGRLLGRFIPANAPQPAFPEFGLTLAQMDQLRTDPAAEWVPADRVLDRLRGRAGTA